MSGETYTIISFLVAIVTAIAYSSTKIAQENERFAVFVTGYFAGFKGPGLVFKTAAHKLVRLKIGDIGTLISYEFARFGEDDIPVAKTEKLRVGDPVRIERFDDSGLYVVKSSVPAKTRCPECGHEF